LLEVAREFDLLVAARGHARDRRLDVLLHLVTHGVQLQADALDLARGWGRGARGSGVQQVRRSRSTEGLYEFAPIRHCGLLRVSESRAPSPEPLEFSPVHALNSVRGGASGERHVGDGRVLTAR